MYKYTLSGDGRAANLNIWSTIPRANASHASLHLEPHLDEPADGFGDVRQVWLMTAPFVDSGDHGSIETDDLFDWK
jgi:hypothetical protein